MNHKDVTNLSDEEYYEYICGKIADGYQLVAEGMYYLEQRASKHHAVDKLGDILTELDDLLDDLDINS